MQTHPRWIRHLAASHHGNFVLAAEFKQTVHVWDLAIRKVVASFDTILDFGGTRLAISEDCLSCAAGAYLVHGIALYSLPYGTILWNRRDLKKVQHLSFSRDDGRVLCGFDARPLHALDRLSGYTADRLRGVREVWESRYEDASLQDGMALALNRPPRKSVSLSRESFAVLAADFGIGSVAVSEAGGPLRCFATSTGQEMWRWARKSEHCLEICYREDINGFLAIVWPYQRGGPRRLVTFEADTGRHFDVAELGEAWEHAFCLGGTYLINSTGALVNTLTGESEFTFPSP